MRLPSYQDLSREQDRINNLPLDGSHLVVGPPGTGKTVMALYRAQKLRQREEPVLLITHSRLLMQYTEQAVSALELRGVVNTFHSWFAGFFNRRYGGEAPQTARYVYDWTAVFGRLEDDPPRKGELPYLIIDEGQDLPREFYVLAQLFSTNITVFADENQRIHTHNSTIGDIRAYGRFGERTHTLTRNYRNTNEIAALADVFATTSTTGTAEPPTRRGEPPRVIHTSRLFDTVDYIARFERQYSDLEIGVFTPTKKLQRSIVNRLEGKTSNPVQHYVGGRGRDATPLDFDRPGIKVVNYPSTKGLEFDVVFIPELQLLDGMPREITDMQMYVMLSRAREQLFLMHSGEGAPAIVRRLPTHLVSSE